MFTPIPCIVTSSQYLRQLSLMYLRSRLPWLVAPLLLCSALSAWMSDVRWAVVGLMLLFIVIPMVLALAYINYALSAEARWSSAACAIVSICSGENHSESRLSSRIIRPLSKW